MTRTLVTRLTGGMGTSVSCGGRFVRGSRVTAEAMGIIGFRV